MSSTLPRMSLGSSASQQQKEKQQLQQHRFISRSRSDGTGKPPATPPTTTASLLRASLSRTHSQTSSSGKPVSESESVDGSADPKIFSDEVFAPTKPMSISPGGGAKPPVMPKPKTLKKNPNGKLLQKLKGKVASKVKLVSRKETEGGSSSSISSASGSVEKTASSPAPVAKGEGRSESGRVEPTTPSLEESLELVSSADESVDLRDYLIETMLPNAPKPPLKPKPKPRLSITTSQTTPGDDHAPSPAPSSTPPKSNDVAESADTEVDIDQVMSMGDLTDWCMQVEDELTQLYNESILSSM